MAIAPVYQLQIFSMSSLTICSEYSTRISYCSRKSSGNFVGGPKHEQRRLVGIDVNFQAGPESIERLFQLSTVPSDAGIPRAVPIVASTKRCQPGA